MTKMGVALTGIFSHASLKHNLNLSALYNQTVLMNV